MSAAIDPARYEAWYATPRGRWIGDVEFAALLALLRPAPGASLLDVGCGTGHFSRRFAAAGLQVTGLDPDPSMLAFARGRGGAVTYLRGDALALPFADRSVDHCSAVTSLCFIADPAQALRELLRVSRGAVVLGLLNRHSLLYLQKRGRGAYRGARWDRADDLRRWLDGIGAAARLETRSAVFLPGGGPLARGLEWVLPSGLPWGGLLCARVAIDPAG